MADTENDIVLTIDGMSKSFGRNRVLDHISMNVRRGTVMGLMGENGAGKSTMMKCLFGTYQKMKARYFLTAKRLISLDQKTHLRMASQWFTRSLTSA